MLAEILLIEYSQRGFEPIVVINDISEAITTYSKGHRQIYYYDDFLGQTGLGEKFNKNEEKSLVKFMKEIRNTKNTRLILTTREYILEQAKSTYEVLDLATPELINCTIDLEDYTRYHRAKILYNHLYFSKLPKQFKIAILENNSFLKIIDHKNFNPRIIDIMTDQFLRFTKDHKIFVQKFIENLDNPSRIWLHAFENQISHASRYLLLSLFSLPEEVMLDDAQRAFNSFCDNNAKQNGFHIEQNAFKKAIKELDGTFIKTERVLRGTLISLHNPSVRDFLRYFLAENDAIYRSLCDSLIFYDQCINLWGTSRQTETTTELRILALKNLDVFTSALVRTFKSDSCLLDVYRHGDRKNPLVLKPQTSLENRFLFVLNLFNAINDKRISSVTGSLLNIIIDNIKSGHANGELLHEIINKIPRDKDCAGLPRTQLIEVMRNFLRSKLDSLEDIMNYTRFAIVLKAKGDKSDFQNAKDCFRSFYKNATEREIENRDNADSLRIFAENLEETGDMLSVDVSEEVGYLNSVADGFEEDRLDHEDIYSDSPHIVEQAPQYSDEDIKTLFETLI
jgi:hypothetical protein